MNLNMILLQAYGQYNQSMPTEVVICLWLLGVTIVFLITRELWGWYFKINALVENQEKHIKLVEHQNKLLERIAGPDNSFVSEGTTISEE